MVALYIIKFWINTCRYICLASFKFWVTIKFWLVLHYNLLHVVWSSQTTQRNLILQQSNWRITAQMPELKLFKSRRRRSTQEGSQLRQYATCVYRGTRPILIFRDVLWEKGKKIAHEKLLKKTQNNMKMRGKFIFSLTVTLCCAGIYTIIINM